MSVGALETAVSGLMAFQRSIATTSNNIANVNTPGYSRQRVELAARDEVYVGPEGYLGTGVAAVAIRRNYDQFLTNQVRSSTSASSQLDTFHQLTTQVDSFIADQDSSLPPALQGFFGAVHDVANEPTSVPVRTAMLTAANTLADRFNTMNAQFDQIRDNVYQSLDDSVAEVNALAANLAGINQRIIDAQSASAGLPANELLDQRDQLLVDLAKQLDVQVIPLNNGAVNVLVGSGQALVMGTEVSQMRLTESTYLGGPKEISLVSRGGSSSITVTDKLTGGAIGGYGSFLQNVLDPAQNELGRVAAAFAHQFNQQHQLGFDLNGDPGQAVFSEAAVGVMGASTNTLPLPVANFADYGALTGNDYRIDVGAGGFAITNLQTHQSTTYAGSTFTHDGIAYDLTGAAAGDSFLIRPTRSAADNFKLLLAIPYDADKIAASQVDPAVAGANAPGDNANALALAGLQTVKGMLNGTGSFQDAYNQLVGKIGTLTKSAETDAAAQKSLLDHARQRRDSVSGVNLDEEASDLIKLQQAYQAAAQTINIVKSTFDALINAVR